MDRRQGFSLWELLVTVAVVATVLSIGMPSFGRMVADTRLRTGINGLFHAVHLARKESVLRRRAVTLCPVDGALECAPTTDWSGGFIMFVNLDRDQPAVRDDGEPLLWQGSVDEKTRVVANRRSFSFRTEAKRATNGTLIFCDRANRAEPRALVVSYTGRPRVTRADPHGNPLSCSR